MKKTKGVASRTILFIVLAIVIVGALVVYAVKYAAPKTETPPPETTPIVVEEKKATAPVKKFQAVAIAPKVAPPCTPETVPNVTLLSPNGGETYSAGQQVTVRWKTCNLGQTLGMTLVGSGPSTTSAFLGEWMSPTLSNKIITIPATTAAGSYVLNISTPPESSPGAEDSSDLTFKITAAPQLSLIDAKKLAVQKWNTYEICTQNNSPSECKDPVVGIEKTDSGYMVYEDAKQLDDSVLMVRRRMIVSYSNGSWSAGADLSQLISCAPGRGHTDFSAVPCE